MNTTVTNKSTNNALHYSKKQSSGVRKRCPWHNTSKFKSAALQRQGKVRDIFLLNEIVLRRRH